MQPTSSSALRTRSVLGAPCSISLARPVPPLYRNAFMVLSKLRSSIPYPRCHLPPPPLLQQPIQGASGKEPMSRNDMTQVFRKDSQLGAEESRFYLESNGWELSKALAQWRAENRWEAEQWAGVRRWRRGAGTGNGRVATGAFFHGFCWRHRCTSCARSSLLLFPSNLEIVLSGATSYYEGVRR